MELFNALLNFILGLAASTVGLFTLAILGALFALPFFCLMVIFL